MEESTKKVKEGHCPVDCVLEAEASASLEEEVIRDLANAEENEAVELEIAAKLDEVKNVSD